MKVITIHNLQLQFDADQMTKGTPEKQAEQAVDLINYALHRYSYGLGAQLIAPSGLAAWVKTETA